MSAPLEETAALLGVPVASVLCQLRVNLDMFRLALVAFDEPTFPLGGRIHGYTREQVVDAIAAIENRMNPPRPA